MDVTFATLIQMVIMDDEEVLTTRSLWSDEALKSAPHLCANQLNLEAVMLALRDEAKKRNLKFEVGRGK
jgi:NADP-dependent 3-hydroxy acid dehydrogenase YdfG